MLPAQAAGVALQTHTTDIMLSDGGAASATSFYRLRNEGRSDALVTVRFAAPTAQGFAALPGDLAVTAGGEPLALQAVDGGSQALVTVPADGRLDVRASYSYSLGDAVLLHVRFPASALDDWPGSTSFRLTVNVPSSIPRESWLRVTPEGWRFGPTEQAGVVAIQWLYEGNIPSDPLLFEYANPSLWNEIVQRRGAAAGGGVSEYLALGASYARLATEAADAAVRDRFYGQALAAYGTALDRGAVTGASPEALAPVYAGQARLYRQRIVGPNGEYSPEHAQLLVDAVARAMGTLPAADPLRPELQQWLNDGLTIVLDGARERRDWQTALDTLDQLAAAPGSAVDPAYIDEQRRTILFEQSLQLLEEGQRDEAVAVSGAGIVGTDLQPPQESQSLFAAWQATMTVHADGAEIHFVGEPASGRELAAGSAATGLAETWAGAASSTGGRVALASVPVAEDPSLPVEIVITLPADATGLPLANATPLRADWALLRSILAQAAPQAEAESTFLRRTVLLGLPLDLRTVGDQWRRLAAELEQKAVSFEAQQPSTNRDDPAALEAALRTKIQAANYRAEANNWSSLADNSQVVALLEGPRGAPADARAWQITVSDPPQTLQYASWGVNSTGVLLLAAAGLLAVLLLAGMLWSLLG